MMAIAFFLLKTKIHECLCFAKFGSGVPQETGHKQKKFICLSDYVKRKKNHSQFAARGKRLCMDRTIFLLKMNS